MKESGGFDDVNFAVGDMVRIECRFSRYDGVVGEVFEIQTTTDYAMIDLPKGTGLRIEGIAENTILKGMKKAKRRPKGDPQWFPRRWLKRINVEEKGTITT